MKRKKRSNHCLFRTFAIKRIGYAFSSAMYKINNTGVAKLAARPLNNTGVEKLSAFSYGGA
ncbi:MAG: hypothetical protein P9X24_15695, partial [Candidatus Hatepunaea meridiana]|nr:hypothetical protein [Candidatus Hatepunaea meridiana]